MAVDAKNRGGWTGRSIRRLEDPALVAGHGRFTGDLPAARWVRFVRSSVASGRIKRIVAPQGATIVTAAELAGVKPIQPLLHKFNYVPISQPVLARDVVRFVGEPIAAVVSSAREEGEDVADLVEVEIEELPVVVGAGAALARGAPLVHAEAAGNVVVEGRLKTAGFDAKVAAAHRRIKVDIRSHRQNALPMEPRAAHAAWDAASERVTLTCATQTPHVMRTVIADLLGMPEADLRVITPALERLMDKAAAAFGLDPIEIRRRNLVKTFPHTSVTGLTFDEASYVETMEAAVKAIGVPAFRARQAKARAEGRYLGLGLATFSERTGYGTQAFAARGMEVTPGWETVEMTMDPSGFVEARIGASPHGQGLRTTLSQIIADELGTSPERIKIVHGDTDRTPYGWGTFASRSLVIAGGASLLAARKIRAKLTKMAGVLAAGSADDIVLEADAARVAGTDRSIPITTLARAAYHQTHRFKGEVAPGIIESATYDPPGTFSNACHVALVEVDVETGRVMIEKFLVAEDAGRLINPMIVDGQIHGGVAQGIANALLEEIVYDETGNILTASLADYLPPTAREIPPIEIHHFETVTQASITKAKGLGEGGAIGAPAAVVNAVNDALSPFGVSIDEFPATPQRIRAALRAAGALNKG